MNYASTSQPASKQSKNPFGISFHACFMFSWWRDDEVRAMLNEVFAG
jgi:hypothetical protein